MALEVLVVVSGARARVKPASAIQAQHQGQVETTRSGALVPGMSPHPTLALKATSEVCARTARRWQHLRVGERRSEQLS